jgi:hypothetical protein
MQEVLAFLALVVGVAAIFALTGLIWPNKILKTRWRSGALLAASLAAMAAIGQAMPPDTSAAPASASPAAPAARPPAIPSREAIRASFLAMQKAMLDAVKPCDAALTKASRTKAVYASYVASRNAQAACRQAGLDVHDNHFADPIPKAAAQDLNAAVDCLGLSYIARSTAMADAAKLMDAAYQRPSDIANFREALRQAIADSRACERQFVRAADQHGFSDLVGQHTDD